MPERAVCGRSVEATLDTQGRVSGRMPAPSQRVRHHRSIAAGADKPEQLVADHRGGAGPDGRIDLPRRLYDEQREAHSGQFLRLEVVKKKSTYKKRGATTRLQVCGILAE